MVTVNKCSQVASGSTHRIVGIGGSNNDSSGGSSSSVGSGGGSRSSSRRSSGSSSKLNFTGKHQCSSGSSSNSGASSLFKIFNKNFKS